MPSNIDVIAKDNKIFENARLNGHLVYQLPKYSTIIKYKDDELVNVNDVWYQYAKYTNTQKSFIESKLAEFISNNPRYFFEHGHVTPTGKINMKDPNATNYYSIGFRVFNPLTWSQVIVSPMSDVTVKDYSDNIVTHLYTDKRYTLERYYNIFRNPNGVTNEVTSEEVASMRKFTKNFTNNEDFICILLENSSHSGYYGNSTLSYRSGDFSFYNREINLNYTLYPRFAVIIKTPVIDVRSGQTKYLTSERSLIGNIGFINIDNFTTKFTEDTDKFPFTLYNEAFPGTSTKYRYKDTSADFKNITEMNIGEDYHSELETSHTTLSLSETNISNTTQGSFPSPYGIYLTSKLNLTKLNNKQGFNGFICYPSGNELTISLGDNDVIDATGKLDSDGYLYNSKTTSFYVNNLYRNKNVELKITPNVYSELVGNSGTKYVHFPNNNFDKNYMNSIWYNVKSMEGTIIESGNICEIKTNDYVSDTNPEYTLYGIGKTINISAGNAVQIVIGLNSIMYNKTNTNVKDAVMSVNISVRDK